MIKLTEKETAESGVRLIGLKAAAQYLGLSYWTMRDIVLGGTIPIVRIPYPRARDGRTVRRVLIDQRDLDALIEQNKERNDVYRSTMNWRSRQYP